MSDDWLTGLKEKLQDYDVAMLIDLLELTPEDILWRFDDLIEVKALELANEIGYKD